MASLIEAALVDFIFYMEDIEKIAEIEPETEGVNTWAALSRNWNVVMIKSRKKRKMKKIVESEGKGIVHGEEGTDDLVTLWE